ncbi:hypothetical protein B7463_g4710, partial [Scytalidium lignicola]
MAEGRNTERVELVKRESPAVPAAAFHSQCPRLDVEHLRTLQKTANGLNQVSSSRFLKDTRARNGGGSLDNFERNLTLETVLPDERGSIEPHSSLLLSSYRSENLTDGQTQPISNTNAAGQTFPPVGSTVPGAAITHPFLPKPSHPSGMITPLDPHNLMMGIEEGRSMCPQKLTQNLLNVLHRQFPIVKDRGDVNIIEPPAFPDPMSSLAGFALQGWGIYDEHGKDKRVSYLTELPSAALPAEDASLLSKWTDEALEEVIKEQNCYFEAGLYGSKRDVAWVLDPIYHELVTEERARGLFEAYWEMVHRQWAILDRSLHTFAFVRSRSAILLTTMLALGSTALATLPQRADEHVAEALRLHAHVEKLNLVVYTTGARSIEIIQAHILLSRWGVSPRTRFEEQRWMRAAMIQRMASEIGLNLSRRYDNGDSDSGKADKLRFSTFSGRVPTDLPHFELDDAELDEVTRLGRHQSAASLAAFYHLYLFDRSVRRRLEQARTTLALDAELDHIESYTERWIQDWCPEDGDQRLNWHLSHDALCCRLLLSVYIARKWPKRSNMIQQQRRLLQLSIRIFKEALEVPLTVHMTHRAGIFPVVAAIILKLSNRRDLVLLLALRMAGEPGKPYVPTFIRDAGSQMLAMLCTSNVRPQARMLQEYDENATLNNNGSSVAVDTSQTQNPNQTPTEYRVQDQTPTHVDWNPPVLDSLPGIGQPFGTQIDAGNLFTFNDVFDFPYIPDPTLSQQDRSHNFMLRSYPSADLDALTSPGVPVAFDNTNAPAQADNNMQTINNENSMHDTTSGTTFGLSLDVIDPNQRHRSQAPPHGPCSDPGALSPSIASTMSRRTAEEGNCNKSQREELLVTISRLVDGNLLSSAQDDIIMSVTLQSGQWWHKPFGMVQTNLREIDVNMDVDVVADWIQDFGATARLIGVGGIQAQYQTELPFQARNPILAERKSGDLVGDALKAAHSRGLILLARMDFSKVSPQVAAEHPEWCYMSPYGNLQEHTAGLVSVCPCGGYYQERIFDILTEVTARYKIDGMFFNWASMNEHDYYKRYHGVCHCISCQVRWLEFSGGLELPKGPDDANYAQWLIFSQQIIDGIITRICSRQTTQSAGSSGITRHRNGQAPGSRPEVPVLVNSTCFLDMPYRMAGEEPAHFAQYLIQAISRGGNPLTYLMGTLGKIPYPCLDTASEITRFHKKWTEVYDGMRPSATTGLVRPYRGYMSSHEDYEQAESEFRGLYSALQELHIPFDVLAAEHLAGIHANGGIERYKVVILHVWRSKVEFWLSSTDNGRIDQGF